MEPKKQNRNNHVTIIFLTCDLKHVTYMFHLGPLVATTESAILLVVTEEGEEEEDDEEANEVAEEEEDDVSWDMTRRRLF